MSIAEAVSASAEPSAAWLDAITALLSAGVGAAAAVVTSLIGQRAAQRQLVRTLRSQEDRHAADLDARRTDREFDAKFAAFAQVVSSLSERRALLVEGLTRYGAAEIPQRLIAIEDHSNWHERWRQARADAELLDPMLVALMHDAFAGLHEVQLQAAADWNVLDALLRQAEVVKVLLRGEMRQSLGF